MKLEEIKECLAKGRGINSKDSAGFALIHQAEDLESIKFLIESDAAANLEDAWGNTALAIAARDGDLERVKFLAKITPSPCFDRALDFALNNYNRHDVIQCLVDFMVEIPEVVLDGLYELLTSALFHERTEDGEKNSWAKIESLKKICAIFNTRKYTLSIGLVHYGAYFFHVSYLKEKWTKFSEQQKIHAAVWACWFGHAEIVKHAVENGVRVEYRMILAAGLERFYDLSKDLVDYLLEKADIDTILTIVRTTIMSDRADVVKIVMASRDLRRSKIDGTYLLPYSVLSGARKCFEALLQCGVAPYAVYPKVYKRSLQTPAGGNVDDVPQNTSDAEIVDFFLGNGPRSARALNAAYSNKVTTS